MHGNAEASHLLRDGLSGTSVRPVINRQKTCQVAVDSRKVFTKPNRASKIRIISLCSSTATWLRTNRSFRLLIAKSFCFNMSSRRWRKARWWTMFCSLLLSVTLRLQRLVFRSSRLLRATELPAGIWPSEAFATTFSTSQGCLKSSRFPLFLSSAGGLCWEISDLFWLSSDVKKGRSAVHLEDWSPCGENSTEVDASW